MKPTRRIVLAMFALVLALCSCSADSGNSNLAQSVNVKNGDSFQIPKDYVVVSLEEGEPGDYALRQRHKEQFFKDLERAVQAREKKICIRNYVPLDITMEFYGLDHGAFWLKGIGYGGKYYAQLGSDTKKTSYFLYDLYYYDLSDQEIASMKREIDDNARRILSKVPAGATEWKAAKIVHDELCRLITYDKTLSLEHTHDLYGALVNHKAVCSAYSIAYYHLMKRLGYSGTMSYSDTHAWNDLHVLSYDRYVDTTWDDTDLKDANGRPYILYDYFFLKREEVSAIDSHAILSGDPYVTYIDEKTPYNYHAHKGYLAKSYDTNGIASMFKRQMAAGNNLLTVRFTNEKDYRKALAWKEQGNADINGILNKVGYYGSYYIWHNDSVRVVNLGLNAPQ